MTKSLVDCQKWPSTYEAIKASRAGLLPPVIAQTTQQRLAKLQALEDSGVVEWQGYESAMEHLQNIQRANLEFAAQPLNTQPAKITKEFWAGLTTSKSIPPEKNLDLALDEVVQEECAEVIQAISKIRRFGMVNHITGYDNQNHLEEEIGQLQAALNALIGKWGLDEKRISQHAEDKNKALIHWASYYERNR